VKVIARRRQRDDVLIPLFKKRGVLQLCNHHRESAGTVANSVKVFRGEGRILIPSREPPGVPGTKLNKTRRVNECWGSEEHRVQHGKHTSVEPNAQRQGQDRQRGE
jgi:hypothetical protein